MIPLRKMMAVMECPDGDVDKLWKFNKILGVADRDFNVTWQAVKDADEIYIDSALINSYMNTGSGNIFNMLMHKAIDEKITDKSIFFFRDFESVKWHNLNKRLVEQVFDQMVYNFSEKPGYPIVTYPAPSNKIFTVEEFPNNERKFVEVNYERLIYDAD